MLTARLVMTGCVGTLGRVQGEGNARGLSKVDGSFSGSVPVPTVARFGDILRVRAADRDGLWLGKADKTNTSPKRKRGTQTVVSLALRA